MARLPNPLLDRWRYAQAAADAADRANFAAAMAFTAGNGKAPPQAEWDAAKELRAHAAILFRLAMVIDRDEDLPPKKLDEN